MVNIAQQIRESIAVKEALLVHPEVLDALAKVIDAAIALYRRGNKTLLAGNGGSAADAQHIAAELVGRYMRNRPSIASLALTTDSSNLTAIGNDFGYDQVFARQLEGMGQKGDMFIGISTSGNSANVLNAFEVAKSKGITTVALVGRDGGAMAKVADYAIVVPSMSTPRIQEAHIMLGHIFCDAIEEALYKDA
ncbi:MAG: phosphoheptose isomerase [Sulfurovum sp. PC08-66]|nr:MAG: phosphoheptose isomerase [Sulfurovum sp. PC08-66]KIM12430.1 MAG: phosphoheptose isomerase [Sulfuricurvum sp. PC08-66]